MPSPGQPPKALNTLPPQRLVAQSGTYTVLRPISSSTVLFDENSSIHQFIHPIIHPSIAPVTGSRRTDGTSTRPCCCHCQQYHHDSTGQVFDGLTMTGGRMCRAGYDESLRPQQHREAEQIIKALSNIFYHHWYRPLVDDVAPRLVNRSRHLCRLYRLGHGGKKEKKSAAEALRQRRSEESLDGRLRQTDRQSG